MAGQDPHSGPEDTEVSGRLQALADRLWPGATVEDLRRLTGGASQDTWSFDVRHGSRLDPMILRHSGSKGQAEPDAVALPDEARLITCVAQHDLPVPEVLYVLRPGDGLGDGFIMRRLGGESFPPRILGSARLSGARRRLARQCGRFLGRLHRIPPDELRFLRRSGAQEELERNYAVYRSYGIRRPVFELAFRWLRDRMPENDSRLALVHGDFRHGNLMVAEDGLQAVIDWELAHLGNPMEDLGWICVASWRFGQLDLPVGGFGTREALFAGYEEAGGGRVDPDLVSWWEVFGTLRWGVICQMMAHSYKTGANRTVERAVVGRRSSEAEIDLMHLLAPLNRG
ncbi:MAG: phosphotransferase family protein [Ectothiorhodospiraceae bacterium]|nr:phosphotransferase family protein [Ectothiorhodospiraceae bacterium]